MTEHESRRDNGGLASRPHGGTTTLWFLLLCLALVVALAYGIGQRQARLSQAIRLEMDRQRAFEQLVDRAQAVEVLLAKGLVTSSGCAGSLVFTDLWHQGLAAQEDVTELPVAHYSIANTAKFMTQVADFSRYLVRKCATDEPMTDEDWTTLANLHTAAGELSLQLNELSGLIAGGGFRWGSLAAAATRVGRTTGQVQGKLGDIAEHMQDLPTLIYDGPFSDHIDTMQPKGIPAGEVTAEQAMAIAKTFAPALGGEQPATYHVVQVGDVAGRIPAYAFALYPPGVTPAPTAPAANVVQPERQGAGPEIRIDVTKQGGRVVWMLVQGILGVDAGEPPTAYGPDVLAQAPAPGTAGGELTLPQAIELAGEYLRSRGFADIVPTFSSLREGIATCQFVASQDGVVLYPDQLKCKVRLADGQILGFEGANWLMNHVERELPTPQITEAQARAKLNSHVSVLGNRLCLIPTPSLNEVLCHEFHITLDGAPFLVYVNATDGEEEAIFRIIDQGDGSQLVM